jgi:signal transduction histidine kinase
MDMLGVRDADQLLGLRPGEAIECVYAHEEADGCGTSQFCSTCGAAIAIVVALGTDRPAERQCAIVAERAGKQVDLYFQVRCCPVVVEGRRFLLLFLRDISAEQERAALERVFYHDVSNLVENLLLGGRLLQDHEHQGESRDLAGRVVELTSRLASEIRVQKVLSRGPGEYDVVMREVSVQQVFQNLRHAFRNHYAARGKTIHWPEPPPGLNVLADTYLVERILANMLINALEATADGGEVKCWVEDGDEALTFCVWNRQCIPAEVARRVFQRNFSTKEGEGRGLGTFSMRLLGETYLRGKVTFRTSDADGTLFQFCLPKRPSRAEGNRERRSRLIP